MKQLNTALKTATSSRSFSILSSDSWWEMCSSGRRTRSVRPGGKYRSIRHTKISEIWTGNFGRMERALKLQCLFLSTTSAHPQSTGNGRSEHPPFCSWMSNIHELSRQYNGDRSLTHSILINLFIKLELSNFLLLPLLSIVFVPECSVVLRKVWRGETRKAYISVESLGKSLSSTSKIEVGNCGFLVVLFRKYVVKFWLSASAHT